VEDKINTIHLLRTRYLEKIRDAEHSLAAMRNKMRLIDELAMELEKMEIDEEPICRTVGENERELLYASTGLRDALLDTVKTLGVGGGITVGEVSKHLLREGFRPKNKNFNISVGLMLKRLPNDQITTALRDGRRVYMPI
jgi:hypothetical protein